MLGVEMTMLLMTSGERRRTSERREGTTVTQADRDEVRRRGQRTMMRRTSSGARPRDDVRYNARG